MLKCLNNLKILNNQFFGLITSTNLKIKLIIYMKYSHNNERFKVKARGR